jgi:hypothetical protein
MKLDRKVLLVLGLAVVLVFGSAVFGAEEVVRGQGGGGQRSFEYGPAAELSQILGRPSDEGVTLSVLSASAIEAYAEFGEAKGKYTGKTDKASSKAGEPFEIEIDGLEADRRYYYRLRHRQPGQGKFVAGDEYTFHTQRASGSTFAFALQGDSHPERLGKMYEPVLYVQTMRNVEKDRPDFYLTMGDDFSLDRLVNREDLSQGKVDQVYAHQRSFLGIVGRSSHLFLVNGNHEQAGQNWLDGTPDNPAVMAGKARTRFYPLPAPDEFYSGDTEEVEFVGLLRDYYAWTWGDALFVVLDPYSHSPAAVDTISVSVSSTDDSGDGSGGGQRGERRGGSGGGGGRGNGSGGGGRGEGRGGRDRGESAGDERRGEGGGKQREGSGGGRQRDWWGMSIGDEQYEWLKKTLEQSNARFKFVFDHHVMGTGRGGVEQAGLYEWGGKDPDGTWRFDEKRPDWEMPIHQLMVKNGVTIFFQGHDHLYARQELDGVIYQEVPNPADATYQAFNSEAYRSGDILPNSGHLLVTVTPKDVRVDYVRSFLPKDETSSQKNGKIAFSYTIESKAKKGR